MKINKKEDICRQLLQNFHPLLADYKFIFILIVIRAIVSASKYLNENLNILGSSGREMNWVIRALQVHYLSGTGNICRIFVTFCM